MNDFNAAINRVESHGLSVAAHLAEQRIELRIFGRPIPFWSQVAKAADKDCLKSYFFGANISVPPPRFSFSGINTRRSLVTFELCAILNFVGSALWFQEHIVPGFVPVDVLHMKRTGGEGATFLTSGQQVTADGPILAIELSNFSNVQRALSQIALVTVTHASDVASFSSFKVRRVSVLGAAQSAPKAAVLLYEDSAQPTLVRGRAISRHSRVQLKRSLGRRLRSSTTGLGTRPKGWALTRSPRSLHGMPEFFRTRFLKTHLWAEGACWLREQFEGNATVPLGLERIVARETCCGVALEVNDLKNLCTQEMNFEHVIDGCGYAEDVERSNHFGQELRDENRCLEHSTKSNSTYESFVTGLRFVGAASAMRLGPLFRFVVGAEYANQTMSSHLASLRSPSK